MEELAVTKQILSQALALPLCADDLDIRLNVSTEEPAYSRDRLKSFVEQNLWLDLEFTRHCITIFRRQCPVEYRSCLKDLESRILW
jgi:hypothetical protein